MIEQIRRFVRARLGYRSWPYRLASDVTTAAAVIRSEGVGIWLRLRQISYMGPGEAVSVQFRSLKYPLLIRPATEDLGAVLNNIVRREYGQFPPRRTPSILVDAGGYIGDTSAFFLNRYPRLRSYVLEPNPDSLEMARRNLAPYSARVEIIPAALCASSGTVRFGGQQAGASIRSEEGFEVEAVTIAQLLNRIPERRIDILKLDIEGAEGEIFGADVSGWLGQVGMIIVETHGPDIDRALEAAMAANGWQMQRYRNLYYCQQGR